MELNWGKWQAIERRHNQLQADVDFCKERLDLATANHRNAEISLLRAVDSGGLFRRVDRAQWLRDARANPEDCLSRHIGQPVESILR